MEKIKSFSMNYIILFLLSNQFLYPIEGLTDAQDESVQDEEDNHNLQKSGSFIQPKFWSEGDRSFSSSNLPHPESEAGQAVSWQRWGEQEV